MADSGKFVVAYPDGLDRAWNVNGGGCCGQPASEGVDDIGFISAAVADIAKNVGDRPAQGLRHRHEQRRHHVLHAGVRHRHLRGDRPGCRRPAEPVPSPRTRRRSCIFMAPPIELCPIAGGQGFKVMNFPPVPESNAFWRNVDQCGDPAVTTDWSGHHVDRRVRRQTRRRARHRRRRRPRLAGLRGPGAVAVLRRPSALIITPLVRLSGKCNIGGMPDTHVVTNQVPPLENHNPASSRGPDRGADPRGRAVGPGRGERARGALRQPRSAALGRARRPQPARPAHPRPRTDTASTRSSTTPPTTS